MTARRVERIFFIEERGKRAGLQEEKRRTTTRGECLFNTNRIAPLMKE
jgi:hypothetical protein